MKGPTQSMMMSSRENPGLRWPSWVILGGDLDKKEPLLITFEAEDKIIMMEV